MSDEIRVRLDAVEELLRALARFRSDMRDFVDAGQRKVLAGQQRLAERVSYWAEEVRRCAAALAHCQEAAAVESMAGETPRDCSGDARALAKAQAALDKAKVWQYRFGQAASVYHAAESRYRQFLGDDLMEMLGWLHMFLERLERARQERP